MPYKAFGNAYQHVEPASLSSNNQILTVQSAGLCATTYFTKSTTINAVDLSDDTSDFGEHLLPVTF